MAPTLIYTACVVGALGLYLLIRPNPRNPLKASALNAGGGLLAVMALGWLISSVTTAVGGGAEAGAESTGGAGGGMVYLLFTLIAVASAVRMITTPRPVYAALYFVLVVIASASMFLLLEAEFMAFALIIVYAGAILITYMFVLMLAQQSPDPDDPTGQPEYDLRPREPLAGALVGFVMLALLTRAIFDGGAEIEPRVTAAEGRIEAWTSLRTMPGRIEDVVADTDDVTGDDESFTLVLAEDGAPRLDIDADGTGARVYVVAGATGGETPVELPIEARPENVQSVGLSLIKRFPVSLEVAGVILLMAMFGAVVLARRQIELTEDETREAAGMRRLGHHDEPDAAEGGVA